MDRREVTQIFTFSIILVSLLLLSPSLVLAQSKSNGETCISAGECASGYCVSGYCSATPPLSSCSEGPIPSSGCNCGNIPYYSGYCCSNAWSGSACGSTYPTPSYVCPTPPTYPTCPSGQYAKSNYDKYL